MAVDITAYKERIRIALGIDLAGDDIDSNFLQAHQLFVQQLQERLNAFLDAKSLTVGLMFDPNWKDFTSDKVDTQGQWDSGFNHAANTFLEHIKTLSAEDLEEAEGLFDQYQNAFDEPRPWNPNSWNGTTLMSSLATDLQIALDFQNEHNPPALDAAYIIGSNLTNNQINLNLIRAHFAYISTTDPADIVIDETFLQVHSAYIKFLQDSFNALTSDENYQEYMVELLDLRAETINANGRWDPDFDTLARDFVAKTYDPEKPDLVEDTINAKKDVGDDILDWGAEVFGSRTEFEESISAIKLMGEQMQQAIEFHDQYITNYVAFKSYLNTHAAENGLGDTPLELTGGLNDPRFIDALKTETGVAQQAVYDAFIQPPATAGGLSYSGHNISDLDNFYFYYQVTKNDAGHFVITERNSFVRQETNMALIEDGKTYAGDDERIIAGLESAMALTGLGTSLDWEARRHLANVTDPSLSTASALAVPAIKTLLNDHGAALGQSTGFVLDANSDQQAVAFFAGFSQATRTINGLIVAQTQTEGSENFVSHLTQVTGLSAAEIQNLIATGEFNERTQALFTAVHTYDNRGDLAGFTDVHFDFMRQTSHLAPEQIKNIPIAAVEQMVNDYYHHDMPEAPSEKFILHDTDSLSDPEVGRAIHLAIRHAQNAIRLHAGTLASLYPVDETEADNIKQFFESVPVTGNLRDTAHTMEAYLRVSELMDGGLQEHAEGNETLTELVDELLPARNFMGDLVMVHAAMSPAQQNALLGSHMVHLREERANSLEAIKPALAELQEFINKHREAINAEIPDESFHIPADIPTEGVASEPAFLDAWPIVSGYYEMVLANRANDNDADQYAEMLGKLGTDMIHAINGHLAGRQILGPDFRFESDLQALNYGPLLVLKQQLNDTADAKLIPGLQGFDFKETALDSAEPEFIAAWNAVRADPRSIMEQPGDLKNFAVSVEDMAAGFDAMLEAKLQESKALRDSITPEDGAEVVEQAQVNLEKLNAYIKKLEEAIPEIKAVSGENATDILEKKKAIAGIRGVMEEDEVRLLIDDRILLGQLFSKENLSDAEVAKGFSIVSELVSLELAMQGLDPSLDPTTLPPEALKEIPPEILRVMALSSSHATYASIPLDVRTALDAAATRLVAGEATPTPNADETPVSEVADVKPAGGATETKASETTFTPGNMPRAGEYSEAAQEVLKDLQRNFGLDATGDFDPNTAHKVSHFIAKALNDYWEMPGTKEPLVYNVPLTSGGEQRYQIYEDGEIYLQNADKTRGERVGNVKEVGYALDDDGNPTDIDDDKTPHIAAFMMMREIYEQKIEDFARPQANFEKEVFYYERLEQATREHLKNYGITEPELVEEIIDALQDSKSQAEFVTKPAAQKIKDTVGTDDKFGRLLDTIWALEEGAWRFRSVNPMASFRAANTHLNQLSSVQSILGYITTGALPNEPARPDTLYDSDIRLDDRFFDERVYNALRMGHPVDGKLIYGPDYNGPALTRDQVAEIALQKFKDLAQDLGIPEKEVTQAMLEGRLNPYFMDFELAFEGLGKPPLDDPDYVETVNHMKEIGIEIHDVYLQGVYYRHRCPLWNEMFGSIGDIESVRTRGYNEDIVVSGDEINYQLLFSLRRGNLTRDYGLTPEMSLQDATNHLNSNPALKEAFLKEMEDMEYLSLFSYFQRGEAHQETPRSFENRYQWLRIHVYTKSPEFLADVEQKNAARLAGQSAAAQPAEGAAEPARDDEQATEAAANETAAAPAEEAGETAQPAAERAPVQAGVLLRSQFAEENSDNLSGAAKEFYVIASGYAELSLPSDAIKETLLQHGDINGFLEFMNTATPEQIANAFGGLAPQANFPLYDGVNKSINSLNKYDIPAYALAWAVMSGSAETVQQVKAALENAAVTLGNAELTLENSSAFDDKPKGFRYSYEEILKNAAELNGLAQSLEAVAAQDPAQIYSTFALWRDEAFKGYDTAPLENKISWKIPHNNIFPVFASSMEAVPSGQKALALQEWEKIANDLGIEFSEMQNPEGSAAPDPSAAETSATETEGPNNRLEDIQATGREITEEPEIIQPPSPDGSGGPDPTADPGIGGR